MDWKPKIAVVGAGAMGCLFGGLLAEGGLDVTLVDVLQEHVDRINRDGLRIVGYGGDRSIPVRATTEPSGLPAVDVLFVQCKAPYTKEAVRRVLHLLRDDSVAISFQNGLGNEENIGEVVGMERVLGGVTAQGAAVEGPGAVRNFGNLPTHIGEMGGGHQREGTSELRPRLTGQDCKQPPCRTFARRYGRSCWPILLSAPRLPLQT